MSDTICLFCGKIIESEKEELDLTIFNPSDESSSYFFSHKKCFKKQANKKIMVFFDDE